MEQRLASLQKRFRELEQVIADPDLPKNPGAYKEAMQEYDHLRETMEVYAEYEARKTELSGAKQMAESEPDAELKAMAAAEIAPLEEELETIENRLKLLLVPRDPLDGKNIIVEIRAGTGGDEASIFAADLYRVYGRYAEIRKWKVEVMSESASEAGGFKEIIFSVSGKNVYGSLRYESGVHRVQRVPVTESQGRIHTSAVTVAVLPEAEETDIEINENDLKIDVYRSSGPGGQSVNTTDSAVRITHLPTGLVVICQDEKSQIKNKAKALRVLRSRLLEAEEAKKHAERAAERKSQVGSGDRSERIRTYNFPQNRVSDHRINLTLYKLEQIMQGEIDDIVDALKVSAIESAIKE
ncbi:MAG: peptide chain release factor 1 [Spirochaeta sp. LUC14_002_19_P3]|nr:MAG: peptide chain release factor 1 [Spirochaeta sp. LUC14_002_19_P3]